MSKLKRMRRRMALLKTMISCTGWGILGGVIMATEIAPEWVGCLLVAGAMCIGVSSLDKHMSSEWRSCK